MAFKKHQDEFNKRLELLEQSIKQTLKKKYKKVSIQKLRLERFFAGREVGVFDQDWKFVLFYYPESLSDLEKFLDGPRAQRYSHYEIIQMQSYEDIYHYFAIEQYQKPSFSDFSV